VRALPRLFLRVIARPAQFKRRGASQVSVAAIFFCRLRAPSGMLSTWSTAGKPTDAGNTNEDVHLRIDTDGAILLKGGSRVGNFVQKREGAYGGTCVLRGTR